jgi:hypothetical protein
MKRGRKRKRERKKEDTDKIKTLFGLKIIVV